MPAETMAAFQDHGEVRGDTVMEDVDAAHELFEKIAKVGVDYEVVTETLELEGVQKFAESFAELLDGVGAKRGELAAV
jgi:transaldolase